MQVLLTQKAEHNLLGTAHKRNGCLTTKQQGPLDLKTGFNQFNLAKQRTKVESIKEGAEARILHIEDLIFFQGSLRCKESPGSN